jgi:hypothetical protein
MSAPRATACKSCLALEALETCAGAVRSRVDAHVDLALLGAADRASRARALAKVAVRIAGDASARPAPAARPARGPGSATATAGTRSAARVARGAARPGAATRTRAATRAPGATARTRASIRRRAARACAARCTRAATEARVEWRTAESVVRLRALDGQCSASAEDERNKQTPSHWAHGRCHETCACTMVMAVDATRRGLMNC